MDTRCWRGKYEQALACFFECRAAIPAGISDGSLRRGWTSLLQLPPFARAQHAVRDVSGDG